MDQLVDSLMEELNCNTVFTILYLAGSMYWNRWWSHGSLWPLS